MRGVRAAAAATVFMAALGEAKAETILPIARPLPFSDARPRRTLGGMRARVAALLFMTSYGDAQLRPRAKTAIPRQSDIAAVRRYGIAATRVALVASLWAEETAGQCVIASNYGKAANFGRVAKFFPYREAPRAHSGARALWAQMRSAGYEFADDPDAVDRLAAGPRATAAIRAMGQNALPPRRAPESRRAA